MQVYYNKADCRDATIPAFRKIKSAESPDSGLSALLLFDLDIVR